MKPLRKAVWFIGLGFLLLGIACGKKAQWPGQYDWGTLLPNRWVLTPVGRQIQVGDLPLNMVLSPDGKLLAVMNNGYSKQFISLIDTERDSVVGELPIKKGFFGVAFSTDGSELYASAGTDDQVLVWKKTGDRWEAHEPINLKAGGEKGTLFPAGLAVAPDNAELYVAENMDSSLAIVNLKTRRVEAQLVLGAYPYDVVLTKDGAKAYVSLWGASKVVVVDTDRRRVLAEVGVGDHPNDMALAPDGAYLYVACANTDEVWVLNTTTDTPVDTIDLRPYAGAPFGSTTNGVALSPDGKMLFVANATNNDVAVVDVSEPTSAVPKGLIPVGWYPTAVAVASTGNKLYVANGKGLTSKPNPRGPNPTVKSTPETQYIGRLFWGTVSVIDMPNDMELAKYTRQTEKNNGFNETAQKLAEKPVGGKPHAIPRRVGEPSLIKHVIYIIKENRTYDQVFGDLPQGNGDPDLCLFGRKVTPNHHALAETFVLLDDFYVDAEVSADGHEWSTGAIATDFVEKIWPTNYSGRGLWYPSEGNFRIAFPTSGYIWEAAARKGISYRSYAEFIDFKGDSVFARHPALVGHFDPKFRPWDLGYPDTLRAAEFIRELKEFEAKGEFPQLVIMRLPNDHTRGTTPGAPTPRAYVAENDLALGMVVEAVSHSKFWKETAIFVIEDDAQNGPDHVDAHRTVALAISPYIRRGTVDHSMYDTVSMLRTIELILGLPPMSQYDAAALPMINAFTDRPDFTPYTALRPEVPLDEKNLKSAYGAEESLAMDFSREDATPELRLNEIIWKSVRGAASEMPRPVTHRWTVADEDATD